VERKVEVKICGRDITLISNEDEAHLQRIARYIDQKMAELTDVNTSAAIDERLRTMLLALNISNDYYKAADRLARVEAEQEKYISEIGRMQQEDMLLKDRYHAQQAEYARLQAENAHLLEKYARLEADHQELMEAYTSDNKIDRALSMNRNDQRKVGHR